MNKLLLYLTLVSGCMSVTHHVATKTDCAPPELVLGDVLGSAIITTEGMFSEDARIVYIGSIALVMSTINWIEQTARCHHLH